MTLRLILMRHAKSAFSLDASLDHERTLTDSGRKSVPKMAAQVFDLSWHPEIVYVSDATRTLETAELFVPIFGAETGLERTPMLYQANASQVIDFLQGKNLTMKTVQVIGHNPTMESLVEHLTSEYVSFEPASVALMSYAGQSWTEALTKKGAWKLDAFLSP